MVKSFKEERDVLLRYLASEMPAGRDIAVVDVGWHGTLQNSLFGLLDKHVQFDGNLFGLYFGTFEQAFEPTDRQNHRGYLFDRGHPAKLVLDCLKGIEVIELLFSSPERGVVRISEHDGRFEPVLAHAPEEERRLEVAARLQEGLFAWLDDVTDVGLGANPVPIAPYVSASLLRLLLRPTTHEAEIIGQVPHSEGFFAGHYRPIVPKVPWAIRPVALKRRHRQAFWQEGFRARLSHPQRLSLEVMHTLTGR